MLLSPGHHYTPLKQDDNTAGNCCCCCCWQVSFSLDARTPAYDGSQCTGFKYHSISAQQPLQLQLGQGLLPPGLELALSQMSKGEKAVFVLPAQQSAATPAAAADAIGKQQQEQQPDSLLPPPPSKAVQVELCIELHDLVQVSAGVECTASAL